MKNFPDMGQPSPHGVMPLLAPPQLCKHGKLRPLRTQLTNAPDIEGRNCDYFNFWILFSAS